MMDDAPETWVMGACSKCGGPCRIYAGADGKSGAYRSAISLYGDRALRAFPCDLCARERRELDADGEDAQRTADYDREIAIRLNGEIAAVERGAAQRYFEQDIPKEFRARHPRRVKAWLAGLEDARTKTRGRKERVA